MKFPLIAAIAALLGTTNIAIGPDNGPLKFRSRVPRQRHQGAPAQQQARIDAAAAKRARKAARRLGK